MYNCGWLSGRGHAQADARHDAERAAEFEAQLDKEREEKLAREKEIDAMQGEIQVAKKIAKRSAPSTNQPALVCCAYVGVLSSLFVLRLVSRLRPDLGGAFRQKPQDQAHQQKTREDERGRVSVVW
eukprot:SAG11_NODE_7856_length_1088_cov_0.835187_1_plen_126_part_00